ncbi:hypothetical protein [Nostoc sp. MG11]|nr:hypothetical protein [Nostoc sp. MG11]
MEIYEKLLNALESAIKREPPEIAKELRRIMCEVTSQVLEELKQQED